MTDILLWTLAIVLTGAVVVSLMYLLAHFDVFFTFVPTGEIKARMAGESLADNGIVVNVSHFRKHTDQEGNLVKIDDEHPDDRSWLNRKLGVYLVGLWPIHTILKYPFRWNKFVKGGDNATSEIVPRDEPVDSVFYRYGYAFIFKDIEIGGNLQVTLEVLANVVAVNPRKMLFASLPPGSWIQQLEGFLKEAVIGFCGTKSIDQLREVVKNSAASLAAGTTPATAIPTGGDSLSRWIEFINEQNPTIPGDGLTERFGAKVETLNFLGIELQGSDAVRESTQAEEVAKGKARAAIALAEGDRKAAMLRGQGEASAYNAKRKAIGDEHFGTALQAEAIKEAKPQVISTGGGQTGVMIPLRERPAPPPASPAT